MNLGYSAGKLAVCFFLYGFLGWVIRVAFTAVKDGHYANMGMLNLPLFVPFGLTEVILLLALPPLNGHPVVQYLLTCGIMVTVYRLAEQFVRNISRRSMEPSQTLPPGAKLLLHLTGALVQLAVYLVIHPFVYTFLDWLPSWSVTGAAVVLTVLLWVDYFSVRRALRTNITSRGGEWTRRMGDSVTRRIWKRLERAYPGVGELEPEQRSRYVFAKGICFDKLVWVFLVSSFLGALIEMVFCRVVDGSWMSRSSVLYGAFSFVWGLGAVLLTVVLHRIAGKEDRKVFLAGAVLGGVYEYLCSVFTELVFGTVFWDYSHIPLNIGGRTNVLYCVFWGLLAVVWIKVLYPPMERQIEKFPPLLGKVLTWGVVAVMLCNGLLTACAMYRYSERQTVPQPSNLMEQLLDESYGDDFMENRWPNMKLTGD